ncbi:hypothetical protein [Microbacterium sp. 77mftsu3.1]|uniref:hypothetical protein n=1 Tax=Microbacterium sp. 77mftsu3.1 TaxID=1761802 RepID=UPI000371372C|nr:hypothetical protein [Microbacterium sp. 77mftsu3.1]SDH37615.1 hypothetical protein SAMN04488590_3172 [Microbacterium sp. 77mftsu3.1]
MTTTMPAYSTTHEMDEEGHPVSLVSIDAHGHLDFEDAEVFLADVVADELATAGYEEGPTFGLEVEHLWRGTRPVPGYESEQEGWVEYVYFAYDEVDTIAVTRFQIASPWAREATSPTAPRAERDRRTGKLLEEGVDSWPVVCIHHPEEPAVTGIPESRFVDPTPAIDGHVHYCAPCYELFSKRLTLATAKALAALRAEEFLYDYDDDVIARAFDFALTTDDLRAVAEGTDLTGRGRRALTAFSEAWKGANGPAIVATALHGNGTRQNLHAADIAHLVEDYTPAA